MIVESRLILDTVRSFEYITCSKCGGESKRIGIASITPPNNVDLTEIRLKDGKLQQ
jgi:hypothetical protein